MALCIHTLHHGVMLGFFFVASDVGKTDFEEIRFRVEPDFYFIGHKSSPALGLSVSRTL
jgi:hypothetical protein